jgi:hypothetical protein
MNTRDILFLTLLTATPSFAQGTAFTYQGRLNDSGSPANGRYDFIFSIFDDAIGGSSLGGSVNANNIGVSNGLFSVALDFGSIPFTGPPRWLQISVSTNETASFVLLAPRQEITRVPYATYANTAGTVTNGAIANAQLAMDSVGSANIRSNAVSAGQIASGQVVKTLNGLTDSVSLIQGANVTINTVGNSLQISAPAGGLALPFSGSGSSSNSIFTLANSGTGPAAAFFGNIGLGTTNPQTPLHVRAGREAIRIQGQASDVSNLGWMSFGNVAGTEIGWVGDGSTTDNSIYLASDSADVILYTSAGRVLTAASTGNVGIGTPTASAGLHIKKEPIPPGGTLALEGTTHTYLSLFPDGVTAGRKGFFGFASATTADITIANEFPGGRIVLANPSGAHFATAGQENLRIVRGVVSETGGIIAGAGFAVTRLAAGLYQITFNPPFAGIPSVTGTLEYQSGSDALTIVSIAVAATGCRFNTFDEIGVSDADSKFHFIAVGGR